MDMSVDVLESSGPQKHPSLLQYRLMLTGLCWARTYVLLRICPHIPTEPATRPLLGNCSVAKGSKKRCPEKGKRSRKQAGQEPGTWDLQLRLPGERTGHDFGYRRMIYRGALSWETGFKLVEWIPGKMLLGWL